MGVPIVYRKTGETSLVNYDFIDLTTGIGIVKLYLGKAASTSGAALYVMSNDTFYSDTIGTEYAIPAGGNWLQGFDYDYDVYVNKPLTIQGKCIVNVPFGTYDACSAFVKVRLRKWDGSIETDIVKGESSIMTGTGAAFKQKVGTIVLTVPNTVFKRGEYIRLTVELWGLNSGGSPVLLFCQDPMSRAPEIASWSPVTVTNPIFQLPMKVDA